MSRNAKKGNKDRVVCFCYDVAESVIVDAIRNGCTSLSDVRRQTYASTGCAGCAEEVKKLLRKHMVEESVAPAEDENDPGKVSNG